MTVATAPHVPRPCTVLLVDDDALISVATSAMLKDLGHRVIEAPSAAQALDILRSGTPVDVVLSDEAMPGMRGTQLATEIRTSWPELPKDSALQLPVLHKPYSQDDLAAAMGELVGGKPSP